MPEPREIAVDEAMKLVGEGTYLLDVREQDEWDRGHTPAAHLIPMSVINDRVTELPEGEPILVICHSGMRSWRVTKALAAAGYDAASVAGGMEAWQSAGGVVVSDSPEAPRP